MRAVQDAAEENKVFESLKTHRRRLAACKKRSSKIIVASTPMPHHHDKHVRRQMESRLNEMLLHSDAVRGMTIIDFIFWVIKINNIGLIPY